MNSYSFAELLEKARSSDSTAEDRLNLFHWMECYDRRSWNGECYDISPSGIPSGSYGYSLYPVYDEIEDEDGEIEYVLIDARLA